MKKQRAFRNPPSTGYTRPAERKFYVWQDRRAAFDDSFAERHGWEKHPWRWLCTLCDPPTEGYRVKKGAWEKIMTVSMPRHFKVRDSHHKVMASRAR